MKRIIAEQLTFKHKKTGIFVHLPCYGDIQEDEILASKTKKEWRSLIINDTDNWERCFMKQMRIPDGISTYKLECKINKAFESCKGYEKIGKIGNSGVSASGIYNPIRVILRLFKFEAQMTGNQELYDKVQRLDKDFHQYGIVNRFNRLLPAPKN